ncbi:MAG: TolC family protein [Planctomycetota bacterium]|nr:TolC family protein [Planctomycetota bacterium]
MNTPRVTAAALSTALLLALGGCKSYERSTLDLDRTQREFLLRALDGPVLEEMNARAQASAGATAFDPSDGISLAEAEAIALVFNRDLRIARLAAGVTQASAENGGLWRDPTLGVDLTQIVSGASQGLEAIVTVGFTLPISGRLELEKQRLGAEHAAELARVADREWQTIAALRRAWTERAATAREVEAARDVLGRVEQVTAIVDRMEQAGELARIEARLFRIEDAKLRSRLASLESDLARASHAVEAILGLPPTAGRAFSGEFASSTRAAAEGRDAVLAAIAATNPAVLAARADYEIAERTLEEEIRKQWPDLDLAPGYGEQDGDRQFVLGIGVVLPVLNGNRAGIAMAEAKREAARGRAESELQRALGALLAAEERLAQSVSRRDALERTLVPLVEAQYEETRAVARLGEVKTLVLLESLKQQLEARNELIAARRDEALAAIDIDELIGPPQRAERDGGSQP